MKIERSMFGMIVRLPVQFIKIYKILRKHNSFFTSFKAALLMVVHHFTLILKIKREWKNQEKQLIQLGQAILPAMVELTQALNRVSEEMKNFMAEDEWQPVGERLKEAIEEMNHMRDGKMPKNTLEDLWKVLPDEEAGKEDDLNARFE